MDRMNVLVVERDADWTQWSATSHLVGHAMLVLAQQDDEPTAAFRTRVQARLARLTQGLNALVLLRGRRSALRVDALVKGLAARAPKNVRMYPSYASGMQAVSSLA
jgi:hypothetical protein